MNYVGQHRAPRPLLRRPVVAVMLLALVVGGPTVAMTTMFGPTGSDGRPGTTIAPIQSPSADQQAIDWPENDEEIEPTTPTVTKSPARTRTDTTRSPGQSPGPDVIRTTFAAHIVITTPVTTNRVIRRSSTTTTTRKAQRPAPAPTTRVTVPETPDPPETPADTTTPESSS